MSGRFTISSSGATTATQASKQDEREGLQKLNSAIASLREELRTTQRDVTRTSYSDLTIEEKIHIADRISDWRSELRKQADKVTEDTTCQVVAATWLANHGKEAATNADLHRKLTAFLINTTKHRRYNKANPARRANTI